MASAAVSYTPLSGNTEQGTWSGLSATANPAPPALDSLIPTTGGGSSAVFTKVSGGAYYIGSGSGIYGSMDTSNPSGPYPSSYTVSDSSPLADLATIIFQARTNLAPESMLLSLNGATSGPLANIAADYSLSVLASAGIFDRAWQWDLSDIAEPITSYTISFTTPAHTLIYASSPLMVDTSDTFTQVIPEPSSLVCLSAGALLLVRRNRRNS